MNFRQTTKQITNNNGKVEENFYEWLFIVDMLGNTENTSVIYDKELKMYFENPAGAVYTYEVEFTNIKLNLCRRLKKSTNFNRKLFYRYDNIQPKVNGEGQIISIGNKAELKQKWTRLKGKIQKDHKGDIVEQYLNKIDKEFTTDEPIYPALHQYLYFGLLFLNVPKLHSDNWVGKRRVEFSPYDCEQFEELTTISSSDDKQIIYDIQGRTLESSNTYIRNYSGYAIKRINDNFAQHIELTASIVKDNIESCWEFKFYKV